MKKSCKNCTDYDIKENLDKYPMNRCLVCKDCDNWRKNEYVESYLEIANETQKKADKNKSTVA